VPEPLSQLFDLSGKTAVVTGASRGLGAAFASILAEAHAHVVLAARSREALEETARQIAATGGTAFALPCDMTEPPQVAAMVEETWRRFGRVDVLVNNAGIIADAGVMPEKISDELFLRTIQVNLCGVWTCCREAGARMLADGRGGSIINITSVLGLAGQADLSPSYQASKAAVINLTRNLACSWGNRGVRVNAIAPGWFPSDLNAKAFRMPGFREFAAGMAPLRRIGEVRELAGPLLFLASNASSFVTGHTLVVDGGISAGAGAATLPDGFYETLAKKMPAGLGTRIDPPKP
jgi:NAD(P)-dependent dehydrogenase (short-subunit alcohol dehydrogenase family)